MYGDVAQIYICIKHLLLLPSPTIPKIGIKTQERLGGGGIAEGKHDYSTSLTISLRVKFDNLVLNVMDATDIKGWLDLILHTVKKSHFFLIWLRKQVMQ